MQKTVAVTELGARFQTMVDEVADQHVPYVLTHGQQPRAALVPYEDFVRLRELSRTELHRRFDRFRAEMREHTAQFSEEEIAADVAATLDELRE